MKSLIDIQQDMSDLYAAVKDGTTELKTASELANIAGKYLKAEQLKLAREIFTSHRGADRQGQLLQSEDQRNALVVLRQ